MQGAHWMEFFMEKGRKKLPNGNAKQHKTSAKIAQKVYFWRISLKNLFFFQTNISTIKFFSSTKKFFYPPTDKYVNSEILP